MEQGEFHCAPPFHTKYKIGPPLGSGTFGKVWSCTERGTGREFACKVLDKSQMERTRTESAVRREIAVMECLSGDHPGVVQLWEVLESAQEVYLVVDLCRGGDLFRLLSTMGRLPEASAQALFTQIVSSLAFCHERGVIHRDIKAENILLDRAGTCLYAPSISQGGSRGESSVQAKLADFGLAVVVEPRGLVSGYNGSRFYVAPEMVRGEPYSTAVDIWSLGVLLFAMLSGRVPFMGEDAEDREGLRRAILHGKVVFTGTCWDGVSALAKDLVSRLLQLDPASRPKARAILSHPWCSPGAQCPSLPALQPPQCLPGQPPRNAPHQAEQGQQQELYTCEGAGSRGNSVLFLSASSGQVSATDWGTARETSLDARGVIPSEMSTRPLETAHRRCPCSRLLTSREAEDPATGVGGHPVPYTSVECPMLAKLAGAFCRICRRKRRQRHHVDRGLVRRNGMCTCAGFIHLRQECRRDIFRCGKLVH